MLLSVATRSLVSHKTVEPALAVLAQHFSPELCGVAVALVSGGASCAALASALAGRICDELDLSMSAADALHSHLVCITV